MCLDYSLGVESRMRIGWRMDFNLSGVDLEWDRTPSLYDCYGFSSFAEPNGHC
jgi:hypothetical protein